MAQPLTASCLGGAQLADGGDGLPAAARALVTASGLDVDLGIDVGRRHGGAVESAVYFCLAEALTNAAKHARGPVIVHVSDAGGEDDAGARRRNPARIAPPRSAERRLARGAHGPSSTLPRSTKPGQEAGSHVHPAGADTPIWTDDLLFTKWRAPPPGPHRGPGARRTAGTPRAPRSAPRWARTADIARVGSRPRVARVAGRRSCARCPRGPRAASGSGTSARTAGSATSVPVPCARRPAGAPGVPAMLRR
jgi:hypothetical protein